MRAAGCLVVWVGYAWRVWCCPFAGEFAYCVSDTVFDLMFQSLRYPSLITAAIDAAQTYLATMAAQLTDWLISEKAKFEASLLELPAKVSQFRDYSNIKHADHVSEEAASLQDVLDAAVTTLKVLNKR